MSKENIEVRSDGRDYLPWDESDFELDPYPFYEVAQREVPVFHDYDGTYVVLRYSDVADFGQHPAMSVEAGWEMAGPWAVARHTIIGRDDPEHARLKRQTTRWFTPKLVKEWVTTTTRVTNELLDQMSGDTIDGWHDLSVIPTHRTMCRVLQVPDSDAGRIKVAMERSMPMLSARPRVGSVEMAEESFALLDEVMTDFTSHRRNNPGDGLLDALIAAQDRGELTPEQMHATALMFYGLGHMDVGYIIASGLELFARNPEVFTQFRDDPAKRDAILNEIVRLDPPELSFYRTTLSDLTSLAPRSQPVPS